VSRRGGTSVACSTARPTVPIRTRGILPCDGGAGIPRHGDSVAADGTACLRRVRGADQARPRPRRVRPRIARGRRV
jgi:hypothetical protein